MSHTLSRAAPADAMFEAEIYPNPPLGASGFAMVMVCCSIVTLMSGLAFWRAGAWPVSGFFGLDLLLLYLAFRAVRRRALRREFIRLDSKGLHVQTTDSRGKPHYWHFEPTWVRIVMDDPPRRNSLLVLRSHGRALGIGRFLTLEERLDLADELDNALRQHRAAILPSGAGPD